MQSKTNRRMIVRKKRIEKAWELRVAGHQVTEIAKILGVSTGQASRDISDAYAEYMKHCTELACDAARMDLLRLDNLLLSYWTAARAGDKKAADLVLRLLTQRERIHGYAAASKQDVTVRTDVQSVQQELLARLEQAQCSPPTS